MLINVVSPISNIMPKSPENTPNSVERYLIYSILAAKDYAKVSNAALPITLRGHATDHLEPETDEYIPREYDDQRKRKVTPTGLWANSPRNY